MGVIGWKQRVERKEAMTEKPLLGTEGCTGPEENVQEMDANKQTPESSPQAEPKAENPTNLSKATPVAGEAGTPEEDNPVHVYTTLTTRQAGAFLHYHPVVIQEMCADGVIYAKRCGRKWVIPAQRFLADFQAGKLKPDFRRGEVKAEKKTSIRTASGKPIMVKKKAEKPAPTQLDKAEEPPEREEPRAPAKAPDESEGFFGLPTLSDKEIHLDRW